MSTGSDPALARKWQHLLEIFREMGSVAVAFSGGVDSALVSAAAHIALGERMCAYTIHSPVEAEDDVHAAAEVALAAGFRHRIVEYNDLENHRFVENSPERCYHCKLARLSALTKLAREDGYAWVAEGSNTDDAADYRPGARAVAELGVRSPLVEAGLTKSEIRALLRQLNLPGWDRPSAPCLATRFPYGAQITAAGLRQIAAAESALKELGFQPVRVRHYERMARLELSPGQIEQAAALREEILARLKPLGYHHVALDLAGYRSGSMNEGLEQ